MYWYWYYLLYSVFAFGFSELDSFPKNRDSSKSNYNHALSSKEDDIVLEDIKSGTVEQNTADVAANVQVEATEPIKPRRRKSRKIRRREKQRRQEDALKGENLNEEDKNAASIEELLLSRKNVREVSEKRTRKNKRNNIISTDELFEMAEAETDPEEKLKYLGLIEESVKVAGHGKPYLKFVQKGQRKKLKIPMKRGLELEGLKEKAKTVWNAIKKSFVNLWGSITSVFRKNKNSGKSEVKDKSNGISYDADKPEQLPNQSVAGLKKTAGTVGEDKACGSHEHRPIKVPGSSPGPPPTHIDPNIRASSQPTSGAVNIIEIPRTGGEKKFKEIAQQYPVSIVYFTLQDCKACHISFPILKGVLEQNNDIPLIVLDCGKQSSKDSMPNNDFQAKLHISKFPAFYAFQKDQIWARVRGYNERTFQHFIAGMRDGFRKPEFEKYLKNLKDWEFGPDKKLVMHETNNEHDSSVPPNF